MARLNEYDKVSLQGKSMDAMIEAIWAERAEVAKILKKGKSKKK